MRKPKVERKTEYFPIIGGQVKATNDSQGIIEGYLNYIGNIDYGDDRTMKGAFRNTIRDSFARKSQQGLDYLWPYLWNHDYNLIPPGGIFDADETAQGLYIKTQFNMDMQMGRELYSSFKMGTMKKQSMGYKAIQVEYVKDDGRTIRNLLEVAVMEGSAVVFPMNDLASVEVVKSTLGKRSFYMPKNMPQRAKDFNDRYREQVIDDWLCSDWYDLTTALRQSIQDLFASGDSPMEDLVNIVLNDSDNSPGFITALKNYVQEGIDLDYSNYLQEQSDANSSGMYWMSNSDSPEAKAGRAISAANMATLKKATDGITGHVKDIKSVMTNAQQQGYPNAGSSRDAASALPESKEDADVSTLLSGLTASILIKDALRGK